MVQPKSLSAVSCFSLFANLGTFFWKMQNPTKIFKFLQRRQLCQIIRFSGITSLILACGFLLRSTCPPRFLAHLATWSRVATVLNTISASSEIRSLVLLWVGCYCTTSSGGRGHFCFVRCSAALRTENSGNPLKTFKAPPLSKLSCQELFPAHLLCSLSCGLYWKFGGSGRSKTETPGRTSFCLGFSFFIQRSKVMLQH